MNDDEKGQRLDDALAQMRRDGKRTRRVAVAAGIATVIAVAALSLGAVVALQDTVEQSSPQGIQP